MAMTVKRRKDVPVKKCVLHRIADIPGGVGVKVSNLGGDFLFEGTPLGAAQNGICEVAKFAIVSLGVADNATTITVEKLHHFKVGDFVAASVGAKAYAITAIDKSDKTKDVITIGTTLGVALEVGDTIFEAKAESATTTSALKVVPQSINGTNYPVTQGDNIFTDAWLIGVTRGNTMPAEMQSALSGIINI